MKHFFCQINCITFFVCRVYLSTIDICFSYKYYMDMDLFGKNMMFLGIGGISMSAIARLCHSMGAVVTGTDITKNENVILLKRDKIAKIKIGNSPTLVQHADIVVYTNAIQESNPDLRLAKRLKKTIYERATLLGLISCKYKHTIAISGTHGKTTTTALLGWIMKTAQQNPTVHIGGISKNFDSNLFLGGTKYFITEACEYKKSFLHLNPNITIINNIELDHPDCYQNFDDVVSCFVQLSRQTKDCLVVNGDSLNKNIFENKNTICFGLKNTNNVYAKNITTQTNTMQFDLIFNGNNLGTINTKLLGTHNVYNILAASATALQLNIDFEIIKESISTFEGTKRRFEILYDQELKMILDYAHHPSEIKSCIDAARMVAKGRIIAIFQPHTYSRTLALLKDFCTCWKGVDMLFLLPTYSAREKVIPGGRAIDIFYNLKGINAQYISNSQSMMYVIDTIKKPNDTIIWLGAGDIENFAKEYAKTLTKVN